jgi:hypothetical protein
MECIPCSKATVSNDCINEFRDCVELGLGTYGYVHMSIPGTTYLCRERETTDVRDRMEGLTRDLLEHIQTLIPRTQTNIITKHETRNTSHIRTDS